MDDLERMDCTLLCGSIDLAHFLHHVDLVSLVWMDNLVCKVSLVPKYVRDKRSSLRITVHPIHSRVNVVKLPSRPLPDHLVIPDTKVWLVNEVTTESLDHVRTERTFLLENNYVYWSRWSQWSPWLPGQSRSVKRHRQGDDHSHVCAL